MFAQLDGNLRKTLWIVVGICVLGGGLATGRLWQGGRAEIVIETRGEAGEVLETALSGEPAGRILGVHVGGAVVHPGLYYLPEDSRVDDAVRKAVPRGDADLDSLNLAQKLSDGQKIFVPAEGEELVSPGLVNLNRASREELMGLPGIGPVTADKILRHRERTGAFQAVEDLLLVDGIGETRLAELRDLVSVY